MTGYRLTTDMDPDVARWIGTGIPPSMRGLSFEDVEKLGSQAEALKKARFYVDGYRQQQAENWRGDPKQRFTYGRGLFFGGAPGTGKTTLAIATACELRRRWGVSVYFARYSDHIQRERQINLASYDTDPEQLSRWTYSVDRVYDAQVVVLDDIGHEHSTASRFAEDTLERIVRGRYSNGQPTILTTNLTGEGMQERYSKALRSFLDQATRRTIFTGETLRKDEQ